MRFTLTLVPTLFVLALVAVPSQACGQAATPESAGGYPDCPEYPVLVDGGVVMFGGNAKGQWMVGAGSEYLVWDEPSLHGFGSVLWSMWLYSESNGLDGLQRGDEACDNTPEGYHSDSLWC